MSTQPAARDGANIHDIYRRLAPDTLREALRKRHLIRRFEESAEQAYMRGLIHGTMHLSIGQEASAVGACMPLGDSDYITSTHRGHGHCIAKGADVKRMFAEFFGLTASGVSFCAVVSSETFTTSAPPAPPAE